MYTLLKKTVCIIVIMAFVVMPVRVYADPGVNELPTGGVIVGGIDEGNIDTSVAGAMTVNQVNQKMIADWSTFNIGADASVQFVQPGASSIALNRVTGVAPSEIFGALSANGRVFILNTSGVLFGPNSQVNTAGLLASSLNITDQNFRDGYYYFAGEGGSVVNQGALNAVGGFVALLGSHVENSGAITADLGTVALASGDVMTVSLDSQSVINVVINEAASENENLDNAAVANLSTGTISAKGGKVLLTAQVVADLFEKAINVDGLVEATEMNDQNGEITLTANDDIYVSGDLAAGTSINASTSEGFVVIDGGSMTAEMDSGSAEVNVSADAVSVVNESEVTAAVEGSGSATVRLTAVEGDLEIDNSEVLAETQEGQATVLLSAAGHYEEIIDEETEGFVTALVGGNIYLISDNEVKATVDATGSESESNGNGAASVVMNAENAIVVDNSFVSAQALGGDTDWAEINMFADTDVEILNSSNILALTSSIMDGSSVEIAAENILIDMSNVTAEVGGGANGSADVYLGTDPDYIGEGDIVTENITIRNGSTVRAQMKSDNENVHARVEMDLTGTLTVENSTVVAEAGAVETDSPGEAKVDINLFGDGEGNVQITGSNVAARANGIGDATVVVYKSDNDGYWEGMLDGLVGDLLDLLGMSMDEDAEVPINGSINITDSAILAKSYGAGFDLDELFNDGEGSDTAAIVGLMSKGPITVQNSEVAAENADAPAMVGLFSDSYVDINASSKIIASSESNIAAVGIAAMGADEGGVSMNVAGQVVANGGEGVGLVALLGDEDVNLTGTVQALGEFNTVAFLTGLLNDYLDVEADLDLGTSLSSAVLIGSLDGDITLGNISADMVAVAALGGLLDLFSGEDDGDEGDSDHGGNIYGTYGRTDADLLLLLARHNIGTDSQYLQMDAAVVAGVSFDTGDIFLYDVDDVQLGMNVPLEVIINGETVTYDLGLPLAAMDGSVTVTSSDDMIVNTVLAPNGNVSLTSAYGSIYGGTAWDVESTEQLLNDVISYIESIDSSIDLGTISLDLGLDGENILAENISMSAYGEIVLDNNKIVAIDEDNASVNMNSRGISIKNSDVSATAENGDSEVSGSASISMYANGCVGISEGGPSAQIVIDNSKVTAQVEGHGSSSVHLQSYFYNYEDGQYEGGIDVLNGSSVLSSVGSGSAYTQFYADDINVVGSTLKATVRDNVDGGTAYLYLYPYNYNYNQDNSISIDSSVLEASTLGRGNARIDLGRNDNNYYYNYGNGNIDITNGSSLLASVGGGDSRVWVWANDISVANSTLKALSTAGLDAAYSHAYVYLYAYDYNYYNYNTEDTHLLLDNALVNADIAGLGQAYIQLYSYNYNYNGYSYGDSYMDILGSSLLSNVGAGYAETYAYCSGPFNITDSSVISRSQAQDTTAGTEGSTYNNYAQTYVYSYDNNNNSYEENINNDLTITNSNILSEVLGDGNAYAYAYTYDYYNSYNNSNSSLFLNNSSVRSSVSGAGSSYVYLQAYDYYSNNDSTLQLNNSQVSSFVGAGDSYSRVYVYGDSIDLANSQITVVNNGTGLEEAYLNARSGSILGDAASLITAKWVDLHAINHIGTLESPINTDASYLSAYSNGSPVWVPSEVEGVDGYYQYGTGNIYVNNIGTDLLNVGDYFSDDDDEDNGGVVQSNNGVVSVTTQGDMVVHNVIAVNGGAFLESLNGSIYAGESHNESGANVYARGYSYFSAPNGTIGVGEPGDEFDGISGQISGVVDPGEAAVTGVDPAPAFDPRYGKPDGFVYYQGPDIVQEVPNPEPEPEPSPSPSPATEEVALYETSETSETTITVTPAPIQSIWPSSGTISEMNNPLKVNIQLIEGAPSAAPVGFTPTSALTLRLGSLVGGGVNPAILVNPLAKDLRAYYEILNRFQFDSFEPTTPTGFYAYNPLNSADTDAYDGIGLDPDAYEFIDGNLKYNGDEDPYKKKKQI